MQHGTSSNDAPQVELALQSRDLGSLGRHRVSVRCNEPKFPPRQQQTNRRPLPPPPLPHYWIDANATARPLPPILPTVSRPATSPFDLTARTHQLQRPALPPSNLRHLSHRPTVAPVFRCSPSFRSRSAKQTKQRTSKQCIPPCHSSQLSSSRIYLPPVLLSATLNLPYSYLSPVPSVQSPAEPSSATPRGYATAPPSASPTPVSLSAAPSLHSAVPPPFCSPLLLTQIQIHKTVHPSIHPSIQSAPHPAFRAARKNYRE